MSLVSVIISNTYLCESLLRDSSFVRNIVAGMGKWSAPGGCAVEGQIP
jgi:hypothetical protein